MAHEYYDLSTPQFGFVEYISLNSHFSQQHWTIFYVILGTYFSNCDSLSGYSQIFGPQNACPDMSLVLFALSTVFTFEPVIH
jgi:hypothetical protein